MELTQTTFIEQARDLNDRLVSHVFPLRRLFVMPMPIESGDRTDHVGYNNYKQVFAALCS
jgi:hypothetical protein